MKYLDLTGLTTFWGKVKNYIDGKALSDTDKNKLDGNIVATLDNFTHNTDNVELYYSAYYSENPDQLLNNENITINAATIDAAGVMSASHVSTLESHTAAISEIREQMDNIATGGTVDLSSYVKKAGDTMTGSLILQPTQGGMPQSLLINDSEGINEVSLDIVNGLVFDGCNGNAISIYHSECLNDINTIFGDTNYSAPFVVANESPEGALYVLINGISGDMSTPVQYQATPNTYQYNTKVHTYGFGIYATRADSSGNITGKDVECAFYGDREVIFYAEGDAIASDFGIKIYNGGSANTYWATDGSQQEITAITSDEISALFN